MKKLYSFLIATAISIATANAQTPDGSDCSLAKEIPTIPDSCAVNEHQLNAGDHEQWHHIKPTQPEMHLKIEPPQTQPEAHIHKASLIKGGCGGMQTIEEKNIAMGETLEITRTDLTVNDDYYIKIERDPTCAQCSAQGGAFYGLCVQKQPAPGSVCTSAVSLSSSNTCNPTDFTMSGMEMWLSFVANSTEVSIFFLNASASEIEILSLYYGSCNSLNLIVTKTFILNYDTLPALNIKNLTSGNTYLIKATAFQPQNNTTLSVCVENISFVPPFVLTPCSGNLCNKNEVLNSEFDLGNTGFFSSLTFFNNFCVLPLPFFSMPNGNYSICSDAGNLNTNWSQTGFGGTGLFLSSDPPQIQPISFLWGQTINVLPNTNYCFSTFVTSLPKTDIAIDPNIGLFVNNTNVASSGSITEGTTTDWTEVKGQWNSGSNSQATIFLANLVPGDAGSGCDIGIDHISFRVDGNPNLPAPSISASAINICQGQTVTLTANTGSVSAPDNYHWLSYNPLTYYSDAATITVSPTVTTTYSLYYEYCAYNSATVSITINVTPPPVSISASPSLVTCGQPITLTAGGASTYVWSNGATGSSITITALGTGTYSVTGTNSNGCTASDSKTITIYPGGLIANAGPDQLICGSGSVSIGGSASGGTSPYTYNWSVIPASGLQYLSNATSPVTQFNYPGGPTGQYICTVTVTDANGCTATDFAIVMINTPVQCCVDAYFPNTNVTNRFQSITINNTNSVTAVLLNGQTSTAVTTVSGLPATFSIRDQMLVNAGTPTLTGKNISFGPTANVLVKKGATLTVSNSTLRGIPCAIMWNGIFVEGDPALSQTQAGAQGKLILTSSVILDAHRGVNNFKVAGFFNFLTGGIIQATNSSFINNRYAATFFPYGGMVTPSISYFKGCDFVTNAPMKDVAAYGQNAGQAAFIFLWQVTLADQSINAIEGNKFRVATSAVTGTARGMGIQTGDALFNVVKGNSNTINTFFNLDVGIDINRSLNVSDGANNIENNTFNRCRVGLQLTGTGGGYSIIGNTFTSPALVSQLGTPNSTIGVIANGANTVDVWINNVFTKMTMGVYYLSTGTYTSDGTNNVIWGNTYTDCYRAVQTQGANNKTAVSCNLFQTPANLSSVYWMSFGGNVKDPQGECNNQPKQPAGNRFIQPTLTSSDIIVGTGSIFTYNRNSGTSTDIIPTWTNLNACPSPQCNVTINNCSSQAFNANVTCNVANVPQFKKRPENLIAQEIAVTTDKEKRMELIREMIFTKIKDNAPDQVIAFLQSVPDTDAKWMLVPEFLKEKKFTDAETTLNGLAKDNLERQKSDDYYRVHIELGKTNRIPNDMTLAEKNTVEAVALSETEISHNAKATLHFWFGQEFMPADWGMMGTNKMGASENGDITGELIPVIITNENVGRISKIYPNPNDGTMRIDYEFEKEQNGLLVIYDLTGREVKKFILNNQNRQLQVNEQELMEGIYLYTVMVNDETIIADKLVIIK